MQPVDLPGSYLVLDLGNACPLRCAHCIQSEPEKHRHFDLWGQMDPHLAYELLDELEREGRRFHALILFWLGEPLLHPDFLTIYQRAAEAAAAGVFNRIEVHTNAVRLTPEIGEAVVQCRGVQQRWHFSLDAVSPAAYRVVKGRELYPQVEAAVRLFLEQRHAARNPDLEVAFQFIPQTGNTHEAVDFVHHWRGVLAGMGQILDVHGRNIPEGAGDCVFFRQLDALDPRKQDAANRRYDRVLRRVGVEETPTLRARAVNRAKGLVPDRLRPSGQKTGPVTCACPFLATIVHWNGQVTVCTRDSQLSLSPGTLADSSFHDIWWENDSMRQLRDAHLRGDAGGLCDGCPIPRSANYTGLAEEDLQRYLEARDG